MNLKHIAKDVRKDIVTMSYNAESAHSGGALSCVEIMVTLYFKLLNVNPKEPMIPNRDRCIFSKGHDAKVLYSVLAHRGYFPLSILEGYEKEGGALAGHPIRNSIPGIEYSSGSLGHGLPIAVGVALAAKKQNQQWKTVVVISDGELNEGTTWESFLFAKHHQLNNLLIIIDDNKLQGFGYSKDILNLNPISKKVKSFGLEYIHINGHSFRQITDAYKKFLTMQKSPTVIHAETIKGLGGIPKHVNQISSQYKSPTKEEYELFIKKI